MTIAQRIEHDIAACIEQLRPLHAAECDAGRAWDQPAMRETQRATRELVARLEVRYDWYAANTAITRLQLGTA